MELTAKTVDEDPASCKRRISGMASRIVTKKIHVVLNQLYSSLWTSRSWFLIKEHWVEIYSNQKAINCILPSNIRASVQTRPPKLPNLLQFSPTSIPDILWASPPPRASRGSAIHVFLVYQRKSQIVAMYSGRVEE